MEKATETKLHHSCHTGGKCCDMPWGGIRYIKLASGEVIKVDPTQEAAIKASSPNIIHRILGSIGLK